MGKLFGSGTLIQAIGVLCGILVLPVSAGRASMTDTSPEAYGFSKGGLSTLNKAMADIVTSGEVSGMVTLIARHGNIVDMQAHGLRDISTRTPMSTDTYFRLYSMTKPVTGVAMMILHEQGKWQLDDPITRFLPEMANLKVMTGADKDGNAIVVDARRPPTMRELLSHTAGFGYGLWGDNPVANAFRNQRVLLSDGPQALIDTVANIPLLFQPGDWWAYSIAVDLQARIVERISGVPYSQFLQEYIFNPLGMAETFYVLPAEDQNRLATLYTHSQDSHALIEVKSGLYAELYAPPLAFEGGGHGLISTAEDYARFASMVANYGELDGVRILKRASVELMLTNQLREGLLIFSDPSGKNPGIPGVGFGLNWAIHTAKPAHGFGPSVGSAFWGGAAGTFFWVDPAKDMVFIGMIQCLGDKKAGCPGEAKLRSIAAYHLYKALTDTSNKRGP